METLFGREGFFKVPAITGHAKHRVAPFVADPGSEPESTSGIHSRTGQGRKRTP